MQRTTAEQTDASQVAGALQMTDPARGPETEARGPETEVRVRLLRGGGGYGGVVLTVQFLPAVLLLTGLHLLLTGSRLARSWWWQDDLNLLARAADQPFGPGLLLSEYNGHLVPASWTVAWIIDRVAPMAWWPAALLILLMVAATDVMLLALLIRFFGRRPAILLPYAMFCATSLTLTSTLWWAAAMQWLPVSLSLLTALWFHVGYLRTGRSWQAAGAVAAVLGGVFCFEKAALIPIVLALFTVAYAFGGRWWSRPWRALRRHPRYWAAHAGLSSGFGAFYLTQATIDTGPTPRTADVLEVTRLMIFETLLPSLIGGPLRWFSTPESTIGAWPHPAAWLVVFAASLTAAAIVGSLALVPGSGRAWLLLSVYLAISVALVATARLGFIGPFIGRDHRYLTDLAVMVPLCLALAWLPLRPGLDPESARINSGADGSRADLSTAGSGSFGSAGSATAGSAGSAAGSAVAGSAANRSTTGGSRRARRRQERFARRRARVSPSSETSATIAAAAVLILTVSGAISAEGFMDTWSKNPSKEYFGNLTAGLAASPRPVYLFGDEVVPDLVMTPTFLTDRQIGQVTRALEIRPVISPVVPYFSVVDDTGRLHDGVVRGVQADLTKPVCADPDTAAIVQLPTALGAGQWKLKLDYTASRQTTARVRVGTNPPVTMRLERGLHQVFVSLQAGGSAQVRLDGLDPDTEVCLGTVILGLPDFDR